MKRWKAEKRADFYWWITDGTESFRMTSKVVAELLASYLNKAPR